jgi:DNA-binding CsgD family transcriptional regulator
MKRTGVIVAIESYLLRKGVVTILNRLTGVTVIREFEAAAPLQKFIQTRNRDLLVLSQSMFEKSGHLLFNEGDLQERTIILTQGKLTEAEGGLPSIDSGDNKENIMNKIQDLMEAQPFTPDESYQLNLSPREKTIVRLVSLGYTNKQIAEELFLSAHTVITHRKNIGHKLGIKSVSGLTVYAIVNNIITIEEVNSNPV